jgi:hypothetical protein
MNLVDLFSLATLIYHILTGHMIIPHRYRIMGHEELFCEIVADNFLSDLVTVPIHIKGNKLDCVLCNQSDIILLILPAFVHILAVFHLIWLYPKNRT